MIISFKKIYMIKVIISMISLFARIFTASTGIKIKRFLTFLYPLMKEYTL